MVDGEKRCNLELYVRCAPVDLSAYRSIKFTAEGEGTMSVMLIKNSVTKWKEQYSAQVKLSADKTNYAISFDDFISNKAAGKAFSADDVTAVVFSWGFNGKQTEFAFKAGEISFSGEEVMSERMLRSKVVSIAPNPSNGSFAMSFASEQDRDLQLSVVDVTGRVLYTQNVAAKMGSNKVTVDLPAALPRPAMLMMTLGNKNVKYTPVKVTVTQ